MTVNQTEIGKHASDKPCHPDQEYQPDCDFVLAADYPKMIHALAL
jgi:hypothetical protein